MKALRILFAANGFEESTILDYRKKSRAQPADSRPPVQSSFDALTRLFIDGDPVSASTLERILHGGVDLLSSLNLIVREGDGWLGMASVAPIGSLMVLSDRWARLPSPRFDPLDVVYPAHTDETLIFLGTLPRIPAEQEVLDIGTGTGIIALQYAKAGCRVVATDILERCCFAAKFNFAFNGMPLPEVLAGDCYQPVRGRAFDLIVSHPPYVPKLKQENVWGDGGQDGEQLVRAVIAGLPDHLRPGGMCHMSALVSDRAAPAEERMREWLGPASSEFSVSLFVRKTYSASEWIHRKGDEWEEPLRAMQIQRFVAGVFQFRRSESARRIYTTRRAAARPVTGQDLAWAADWDNIAARDLTEVLNAPLRIPPTAKLQVTYAHADGEWIIEKERYVSEYVFDANSAVVPWVQALLSKIDGKRNTIEYLKELQDEGLVPPDVTPELFVSRLAPLLGAGLLESALAPLPAPSEHQA